MNNRKRILLWILIPVAVLVLAGAGFLVYTKITVDRTYQDAMQTAQTAPYQMAQSRIAEAIASLNGKLFSEEPIKALAEQSAQLLEQEVDRAIESGDLAYAASLLDSEDAVRAQSLRDDLKIRETELKNRETYALAEAYERDGEDEQALETYRSLGSYEDAAARADAVQARIDYRAAEAVFTGANYDEGIAALRALGTEQGETAAQALELQKEEYRLSLEETAHGILAAGAWHTSAAGTAPWIMGDARYAAAPAEADVAVSGLTSALYLKNGTVLTTGETFGEETLIASWSDVKDAAPGLTHALFLHEDGTVSGVGSKALGRLDVSDWNGITDVAAGAWHSVGVKADGTVVACGKNEKGLCDVADWKDVIAVSAGLWHTVALRSDGTAVAAGDNTYGQCDVADWTDLKAIACGACFTIGLKTDGTVVACGDNAAGQCSVDAWKDVVAVAAGAYHAVGVRLDGTLIGAGFLPESLPDEPLFASEWPCEAIETVEPEHPEATAYIEGVGETLGPWLYLDSNGAVVICLDDSEEKILFRTDLLATANAIPTGRVTQPEATGRIIKMESVLPEIQARKQHAVVSFTGDYLGYTSNRKAVMIRNGIVYYDRAETTSYAILPDGTLKIYGQGETNAEQLQALGVKDSFSFGPILVKDGQLAYDDGGKPGTITMRVAFGYSDPYHYIVPITMRDRIVQMSYGMIAKVCMRYGCRAAYNLDGGHSTSLVFMGQELSLLTLTDTPHGNIRGLSDIVIFLENDAVQPKDSDLK